MTVPLRIPRIQSPKFYGHTGSVPNPDCAFNTSIAILPRCPEADEHFVECPFSEMLSKMIAKKARIFGDAEIDSGGVKRDVGVSVSNRQTISSFTFLDPRITRETANAG
jgi:hypothetical protein